MRNKHTGGAMRAPANAKALGYRLREVEYGGLLSLCCLFVVVALSTLFRELITKR
jgi:hypothetical protein